MAGGGGTEGNGCARFVEIATQTVNLTNILTNLNSSVTNCNNTSKPNGDQQMVSMTMISSSITTMPLPEEKQHEPDAVVHQSQLHNPKNNNGHCIIDGTPNPPNDDVTQVAPLLHHTFEIADIDAGPIIDTYQADSTNSDIVLKHDSSASVTDITVELTTTAKTPIENDTTATTDDTDLGKKHAATDASGINGPANDLRV